MKIVGRRIETCSCRTRMPVLQLVISGGDGRMISSGEYGCSIDALELRDAGVKIDSMRWTAASISGIAETVKH